MTTEIDGQSYTRIGEITPSKGTGESKEEFSFIWLRGPDGVDCWLQNDEKKWWLYRGPHQPNPTFTIKTTHEVFAADRVSQVNVESGAQNTGEGGAQSYTWVALEESFDDEPMPFRGTSEGLVIGAPEDGNFLLSVPLMLVKPDVYYSANFPVSATPREPVALKPVGELGQKALVVGTALMMVVFGAAALLGIAAPVQLFWWIGPLAILLRMATTRNSLVDQVLRLVGGIFFLHFASHAIDYMATSSWEEADAPLFESARLSLMCAGLLGLKFTHPRLFFAILDGSAVAGGCSWMLMVIFLGSMSMDQEDNYFQWFSWYSGMLPWSLLWLAGLGWGVWYKYKDYLAVPLNLKGFRSLLYRTAELLEQPTPAPIRQAEQLEKWADDMGDALAISAAPLVLSLTGYQAQFLAWHEQAKALKNVAVADLSESDEAALDQELKTIAKDFRDLIAAIDGMPATSGEFQNLRRSPKIATWDH